MSDRRQTALPEPPDPEQYKQLLLNLGYALERLGDALQHVGKRANDAVIEYARFTSAWRAWQPTAEEFELAGLPLSTETEDGEKTDDSEDSDDQHRS